MKAKVTTLYENGTRTREGKTVEGDLNLNRAYEGNYEACILAESGIFLLPDLYDAKCICIAAKGIRLRGFEVVNGQELAQEWWCIPG